MAFRVFVVVIDGLGVGALPDASSFGDEGTNTLVHVSRVAGGVLLPYLAGLGLGAVVPEARLLPQAGGSVSGAHGRMAQAAGGKDTLSGHWELMGLVREEPFPVYPGGFPAGLVRDLELAAGTRFLGNRPASGTRILDELGAEHLRTGWPILYTSADSVLQLAAHEEVVPPTELYRICAAARALFPVGRVIARPFRGEPGAFARTEGRRDYALPPPGPTLLDRVAEAGHEVWAIGKVEDIFAGRGVTRSVRGSGNREVAAGLATSARLAGSGLVLATLADTDSRYGHRNDPQGFARELECLDGYLARLAATLGPTDRLFVTADHGCDPTSAGTDHTREYVPVLVGGVMRAVDVGTRATMADLAATVGDLLELPAGGTGRSFARELEG
ncbi:MAG: phosphopentomutase [bacterium]|nr:phosphopentomutase [bacterium]